MKQKQSSFIVTVLIVLALSMLWTVPVLADEGQPPSEETAASETQPLDETAEGEGPAPVDEPAEVEEEPATEETVPASEPAPAAAEEPVTEGTEPASETEPEETLLEQLPEDTTIVVVDESGEPLPLVTQEAAEAVAAMPDPQWCPVGAAPGSATCSPSFTYFNGVGGLLEWLAANDPGKAGVIWIEASYDSSDAGDLTAVEIDGGTLVNMSNFALTINGGWNGPGTNTMNPLTPSEFNVPFRILDWTGAITLNNLLITGATGTGGVLDVFTEGNITVNNVDVVDNTTQYGVQLSNDYPDVASNVVVNDSTFNSTGGNTYGLVIWSFGTVTLKNVTANENMGYGLYINNSDAATPKAVTLTGSNQFLRNGTSGLTIYSKGVITLSNITAEGNGRYGADLYNDYLNITSGVTLKGASSFNNNGWDGLTIYSNGAVMLANITANYNGWEPTRPAATQTSDPDTIPLNGDEIYWYDAAGKGAVIINWVSVSPKGVTLTGVNTFNGNASAGLLVDTAGLLTASNLTANDNGCDPNYEGFDYTRYCAGAFLWGAGVTVSGYGNFSGNAEKGLHAENNYVSSVGASVGAVTLNNIFAQGNGDRGVFASTDGNSAYNVSLLGVNTFLDNGATGVSVYSNGAVTLNNITSNGNGGSGVYADNTYAASAKSVVFVGAGTYIGNVSNGILVYSKGAITTNGLTVLDNGGIGVRLNNCYDDTTAGVCDAFASQAVNVNGVNTISNNAGSGLNINSRGAVTISSLTTSNNLSSGVYVDNQFSNSAGNVTFKNYLNSFSNGINGATVYSRGAVLLANVRADSNTEHGLLIDNAYVPTTQSNVTITGTNSFSSNGLSGLLIDSYGVVALNNVFANGNGEFGAYINNNYNGDGIAAKKVTLTGVNFFNGNAHQGLTVYSLGAVVVNKVMANSNGNIGILLNNQDNLFSQPVTVVGYGVANGNAGVGIQVNSNGSVTLANLTANNNANFGTLIANHSLTTTPQTTALSVNVTLTGVNTFNGNLFDGLSISSDGVITLNSVTASYNGLAGLFVDNVSAPGGSVGKGLTLKGWNTFIGNGNTGLSFNISGNVILNRVVSSYNDDDAGPNSASGIVGTSTGGAITLTCASLNGNEAYGYDLSALGMITLKGVFTHGNPLNDTASGTPVIVTRTCTLP